MLDTATFFCYNVIMKKIYETAESNIHSKWVLIFGLKRPYCMNCLKSSRDAQAENGVQYCPHCGAKMDLEDIKNDQ